MGTSRLNAKGQGFPHLTNPASSRVPPMSVLGSTAIPLVFDPEDKVRYIPIHVVEWLPYALGLGTSFFARNKSNISFGQHGGFQPFA